MITLLRRLVYFGGVFIAIMGVITIMIKADLGYVPKDLKLFMLILIFVIGLSLVIVIAKRGLGG